MFVPEAVTASGKRPGRPRQSPPGGGAAARHGLCRLAFVLVASSLPACGGRSQDVLARRGSSAERRTPAVVADAGVPADAGVGSRSLPPKKPNLFDDPGCPPAQKRPDINSCDPFTTPSGCGEGLACFPFVSYPTGPCEVERFGTVCAEAGAGVQGDSCDTARCAPGHICVSSARGTRCVRLCAFASGEALSCPGGLLCLPIDIEGFGGCL